MNASVRSASVLACCVVAALGVACSAKSGSSAATANTETAYADNRLPGQTYASLATLPDWSGSWSNEGPVLIELGKGMTTALKPELMEQFLELGQRIQAVEGINRRAHLCKPYVFGGYSGGFEGSIEFLFNPGRITILWEGGLARRIYTDGRPLPDDPAASNSGTSIGHWDGQTLVVDTAGLQPGVAPFGGPFGIGADPISLGAGARVSERIYLKSPNVLQFDTALHSSKLFTKPALVSLLYQRRRNLPMGEFTACPENDRSLDSKTGFQRFDLTPPADLPPPPPAT
jgi:hypothetical protein